MNHVEIVAVGNELLTGDTLDTNTNWLCKRLTMLGARVNQVAVVRDDPQSIVDAIRAARTRKPSLLITIGGMGPTPDDLTVQSVGTAVGRDAVLNDIAVEMIGARYKELVSEGKADSAEMTSARKKMAYLPIGAVPIPNGVGTAPGVYVKLEDTVVICLPGVPAEMKGLVDGALQSYLQDILGNASAAERNFLVACNDESTLAPLIVELSGRHGDTTFKSRPKRYGADVRLRVRIFAVGNTKSEVREKLDRAVADFLKTVAEAKFGVEEQSDG